MRAKKLTVKNIGLIADSSIELNKPLIILYGEVQQGKSTFLNAVRWVFGGTFPTDIIRHGESEAEICFETDCGSVTRTFYVAKDDTTKARPVIFIRDGRPVANPVEELKKFLNPFLIDQDYLVKMNEPDRKRFFVKLFNVDTSDIDGQIAQGEEQSRQLRAKISGYGEIDLTEQKPVDIGALNQQVAAARDTFLAAQASRRVELAALREAYRQSCEVTNAYNKTVVERNDQRKIVRLRMDTRLKEMNELAERLEKLNSEQTADSYFLTENPAQAELAESPVQSPRIAELEAIIQLSRPDIDELNRQIMEGAAQNVRAEQYQRNKARAEAKRVDEVRLEDTRDGIDKLRREKISRLAKLAADCRVPGVTFDEDGNLTYNGTQAGMLSTSQLMQLSSQLSALYPEGFGLNLIDRGESLGKSIFALIDEAKAQSKTVLATVVGERPTSVPDEVGVFVVEKGELK